MQPWSRYIGETAKKLGTRLNEHRKSVRATVILQSQVCCEDAMASVQVIGRENHLLRRKICPSLHEVAKNWRIVSLC